MDKAWEIANLDGIGPINVQDIAIVVNVIKGLVPIANNANLVYIDPIDNTKHYSFIRSGHLNYIANTDGNLAINVQDIGRMVDIIKEVRNVSQGQGDEEGFWPRTNPGVPTGITYDSANSPKELVLNFPRQLRDLTSNETTLFPGSTFYGELKTCFKIHADNNNSVGDILDTQPVFSVSITNDNDEDTGKLTITLDAQPDTETKYWIVYTGKFQEGDNQYCPTNDSLVYKSFTKNAYSHCLKGVLINSFSAGPYTVPAGASNVAGPGAAVAMTVTVAGGKYVITDANSTAFTRSISLLHEKYKFDISNASNFQVTDSNGVQTGDHSTTEIDIKINSRTPTLYFSDSTDANTTGGVIYILPPWLGPPTQDQ